MSAKRSLCLLLVLLMFSFAGCGKAESIKNYRAYATDYVNTNVTDEKVQDYLLKIIKGWKKMKDYEDFEYLMGIFSSGYIKTYDKWVAAGCPTPIPTVKPEKDSGKSTTTAKTQTQTPQPQAQTQTPTQAQTAQAQTPQPQQSGGAVGSAGGAPAGGGASGGPSGGPGGEQ